MPYLYASNRGHGPLIVYEISQDGSLLQKQVNHIIRHGTAVSKITVSTVRQ